LRRLEADRTALAQKVDRPPTPSQVEERRYELRLVDHRMFMLRRMKVAAERIEPTVAIAETLGPRPEDPHKARAWAEGVDAIHGFRVRWGIEDSEAESLGPPSDDFRRRQDRDQVARRIREIQSTLDLERRALEVELDR
jgi:hypothetical protein